MSLRSLLANNPASLLGLHGTFNVLNYGADPTGVRDSTAAIQAAVDAAIKAGGGKVVLSGLFRTSATITVLGSFVTLTGQGMGYDRADAPVYPNGADYNTPYSGGIKPLASFPSGDPLLVFGESASGYYYQNGAVENLFLTGDSADASGAPNVVAGDIIQCWNTQVHRIHDCWIQDSLGYGVYEYSNLAGGVSWSVVRENVIYNTGKSGIYIDAGMVYDYVIGNAVIGAHDYGIGYTSAQGYIFDNHVESTHYTVGGPGWSGSGIYLTSVNGIVSRNDITNSDFHGIYANGSGAIVSGNNVRNSNQASQSLGGVGGCGIYTETSTPVALIDRNVISDTTSKMQYSLRVQVAAGAQPAVLITGNQVQAGADGTVFAYAASAAIFRDNVGYNPTGPQAAPAVPASTTAFTNPFPFDCTVYVAGGTVTAIAVGGTATGMTSGPVRVGAGQTITLTYTAAPTWTWFGE